MTSVMDNMHTEKVTSKDDVVEAIDCVSKYLQRPLGPAGAQPYVDAFTGVPRDAFIETVKRWMDTHGASSFLPSVFELRTVLREVELNMFRRRRGTAPPLFRDAASHARSDLARDTFALMEQRMNGTLNHAQYVEAMRAMETKYPGIGWSECASQLDVLVADDKVERAVAGS